MNEQTLVAMYKHVALILTILACLFCIEAYKRGDWHEVQCLIPCMSVLIMGWPLGLGFLAVKTCFGQW